MTFAIIIAVLLFFLMLLTLLPSVPGILFMFIAVVVYGLVDGFSTLDPWHLAIFGGITALSMAVDYFSGIIGAKLGGASKKAVLFGLIGLVIGLISFPPLGAFAGLFAGVFIAELVQFRDHMRALKAASFSLAGAAAGMIINICLAVIFWAIFLILVF